MRLTTPVGIAAASTWLPESRSRAETAVAEGRLLQRHATDLGHGDVPSTEHESPPDMAVRAARSAIETACVDAAELDMVCHAWMYFQGHDLWSPAHYIAHQLGARSAFPVGVQQICNGGAAGIELVVPRLAMARGEGTGLGLVTTADRFAPPGFDRWSSDYGVAYGDGATAVLLRSPADAADVLTLRSVASVAAPELEAMHRGADPFALAARTQRTQVNMRATKRAYLLAHGDVAFVDANQRSIQKVVAAALDDAGLKEDDPRLRLAVLPRFGSKILREVWVPILSACVRATPMDWGQATGHLGAGDSLANLTDLVRFEALAPGEIALVFSAGAGFTWSCLVVQA